MYQKLLAATLPSIVVGVSLLGCGEPQDTARSSARRHDRTPEHREPTPRQLWERELAEYSQAVEREILSAVDMDDFSAAVQQQFTGPGKVVYSGERIRLVIGRFPNGQIRFALSQLRESISSPWVTIGTQQRCWDKDGNSLHFGYDGEDFVGVVEMQALDGTRLYDVLFDESECIIDCFTYDPITGERDLPPEWPENYLGRNLDLLQQFPHFYQLIQSCKQILNSIEEIP